MAVDMKRWLCAVVVVVGLVACSSPGPVECARNTCSGCCTADGECVLGTVTDSCGRFGGQCVDCSSSGLVCGSGACTPVDAGTDAGSTVKDAGVDSGVDSGTPDAGPDPMVTAQMNYYRRIITNDAECPPWLDYEQCNLPETVPLSKAQSLEAEYADAGCDTEWVLPDWLQIRCQVNDWCTDQPRNHTCADGGVVEIGWCTFAPRTAEASCGWFP